MSERFLLLVPGDSLGIVRRIRSLSVAAPRLVEDQDWAERD
jgi:hypothetical protein